MIGGAGANAWKTGFPSGTYRSLAMRGSMVEVGAHPTRLLTRRGAISRLGGIQKRGYRGNQRFAQGVSKWVLPKRETKRRTSTAPTRVVCEPVCNRDLLGIALMGPPLRSLALVLALVAADGHPVRGASEGSKPPLGENACATCHGDVESWEGDQLRLYIPAEAYADDVHRQKGVQCHDCHGGDPTAVDSADLHAPADGFRTLAEVRKACADCHEAQVLGLAKGVHAKAGPGNERGEGRPMDCGACHGEDSHWIVPAADARSPVFPNNQVRVCGECHESYLQTYTESVHGSGLFESGLTTTAVCSSCHGAHDICYAADNRSTLHPSNVADTCGQCHRFIQERLQRSVHGQGAATVAGALTPGEEPRKPGCTDCHEGHDVSRPDFSPFRSEVVSRCGNCHVDLSSRYAMSLHGELTQLGYVPAAKCADCHGAHDILPVADPRSRVAAGERRRTCRQCHPYAVANFTAFDPHADYQDAHAYPFLHHSYHWLKALFLFFFGFFVVHAFLWFFRSFLHTLQHGRHKTLVAEQYALVRFGSLDRAVYVILMVSFLGLTLTGLPLKFSSHHWAQSLARSLGGFESTSVWHRFFAVATIFACASHVVWAASRIVKLRREGRAWKALVFGPDSPVPTWKDLRDMFHMARWFLGMGRRPTFERWAYWEKFDYWAVYLAAVVIVGSGLILWFSNPFCLILPGETLNVAKVIHSEIAILAASFLFIFHFFHTHVRPEKFPMDPSALTGLVSEEHLRQFRPEYVRRLHREGRLAELRREVPSRNRLRLVMLGGFVVLLAGCGLLMAVVVASLGK